LNAGWVYLLVPDQHVPHIQVRVTRLHQDDVGDRSTQASQKRRHDPVIDPFLLFPLVRRLAHRAIAMLLVGLRELAPPRGEAVFVDERHGPAAIACGFQRAQEGTAVQTNAAKGSTFFHRNLIKWVKKNIYDLQQSL